MSGSYWVIDEVEFCGCIGSICQQPERLVSLLFVLPDIDLSADESDVKENVQIELSDPSPSSSGVSSTPDSGIAEDMEFRALMTRQTDVVHGPRRIASAQEMKILVCVFNFFLDLSFNSEVISDTQSSFKEIPMR